MEDKEVEIVENAVLEIPLTEEMEKEFTDGKGGSDE